MNADINTKLQDIFKLFEGIQNASNEKKVIFGIFKIKNNSLLRSVVHLTMPIIRVKIHSIQNQLKELSQ